MKTRLIALAVIVLACIGGSGALASTASASNCTQIGQSPTYYDGQMAFNAYIGSCSGVDYVQFGMGGCPGCAGSMGAWWDYTYINSAIATEIQGSNIQYVPSFGQVDAVTYRRAPWCAGQTHLIYTYWWYRIRSTPGLTWGSWHQKTSGNYQIVC